MPKIVAITKYGSCVGDLMSSNDGDDDDAKTAKLKLLLSGQNLVYLATIMPDGSPQVTPVWASYEGGFVMANTAEGRTKHHNIVRDKRVALSVTSICDPLQMVSVRGTVDEIIPDLDYVHADALTRQYTEGRRDRYPFRRPGERRITLKIRPLSVYVMPQMQPSLTG